MKIILYLFLLIPFVVDADATLGFVGDIMMHGPQIKAGYNTKTKDYDFKSFFTDISSTTKAYDYMIGNLETPVAGSRFGYGSYPSFNAPTPILDALVNAGFDALSVANNHIYDKGLKGASSTLDNIIDKNIKPLGVSYIKNDYQIIIVNDVKLGVYAFTYGFNTGDNSSKSNFIINKYNYNELKNVISEMKSNVDYIILLPHYGKEYQRHVTKEDKILFESWIDMGADIIVGSHPHVLKPIQIYKDKLIAYSLGNFISNQQDVYTDLGGLLEINFKKDKSFKYILKKTFVERKPYKVKELDKLEFTSKRINLYK